MPGADPPQARPAEDDHSPSLAHLEHPVLLVDDEPDNVDAFAFNFRRVFNLHTAGSGAAGLDVLREHDVGVIITDQRMPNMTGIEFLRRARELRPEAIGIIVTAYRDEDVMIEAIKLGHVFRFVVKPWDRDEMQAVTAQALEQFHLRRENKRLSAQLRQYAGYLEREMMEAFDFGQIIGEAPSLLAILEQVEQVAPTSSTVLLRGETGTGKELLAHAIHINSPREERPFVKVNCAALSPGVLESELFGHEKGAFTGAIAQRIGRFELADGGTLFLDEVGDLPAEVQIKLLRVLQEREFERIGGDETVQVDVRLVSATNRNLEELIARGSFRQDLYYRLNVFPVLIPPLRDRKEDIPELAAHFLRKFGLEMGKRADAIAPDALNKLRDYDWPGNVRELENVIERALILSKGPTITPSELDFGPVQVMPAAAPLTAAPSGSMAAISPPGGGPLVASPSGSYPVNAAAGQADAGRPLGQRLDDEERSQIIAALEQTGGNVAAAARQLGLNRSTLYYRLRKLDLLTLLPRKG